MEDPLGDIPKVRLLGHLYKAGRKLNDTPGAQFDPTVVLQQEFFRKS